MTNVKNKTQKNDNDYNWSLFVMSFFESGI